tara:strand:+ start:525 stop:1919 length:1395 start_codon:yes stop_codon:yes gene_type:complete
MTYIGNPHGTGFSKIDSQQFSGNGSLTAFTMRHPVGQPEHVEVYVNNVRQDPHSAYTVSGTTLTFTEAPGNATNNIYVVYIGGAIGTADIPPDTNLSLKQGLKSAPSLFKNDTIQTGMYFPAANAIAFVQGDKEIFRANNSIIELKISGTTVATINSTGMNIAGGVFDDGTALLSSVTANTQLGSGIVTQHAIASGNVVTSTINDGAVTASKIAAGNVVTAAINHHAITADKIDDGVISAAKMASAFINANTDFASALVDASNIKADAINPQHIADGAINANTMIAANIIDASNIKAGAVGTSELASASVTGTELAAGAVSANTKMAADVVGARELRIGNVAAANGVFTHNAHIYAKAQRSRVETVTVGAANVTIDLANTNVFNLTLGTNSNLNRPSNITVGQAGTIFVSQDGTGSRTLSYSSVWDFVGGTAPTLTTTASAVDRIDYVVFSTSRIQAVATLAYS